MDTNAATSVVTDQAIAQFFTSPAFAVVGATVARHKYGNKVLRCYQQHGLQVYPVNPKETQVEGLASYSQVLELPATVHSISIVTPPRVTEQIVQQALAKGIANIWMQPGAESEVAINFCQQHKINVLAKGPCLLVYLRYTEGYTEGYS